MTARDPYDLLVVGGGVNGCGIARDAAGRGLSVLLCEKDDLAAGTSSASTKLIHGGLRYLEYYEFRLVRAALKERETLLRMAPHIIRPLRFVLPHAKGLRPAWMIRLGLFLYDHLGGRELLPGTETADLAGGPLGAPLEAGFRKGFIYSDCWVEDARLVVLNALDAAERGAEIRTRTELVSGMREAGLWRAELRDGMTGERSTVTARALVNAGGPWASQVLRQRLGDNRGSDLRLVKGSHIVVRRLFDHDHAYVFQNPDRRIVFAIPYETDFTLIGTTDVDYLDDPDKVHITGDETVYLCDAINRYFRRKISPDDVVWSYSGVRPLYDDETESAAAATREYVLELDAPSDQAPLVNVFGGKITIYRKLSEQALDRLRPKLGFADGPWTEGVPLPGGDMQKADFSEFLADRRRRYPWLPEGLARRYARAYGTRMDRLLDGAGRLEDLGADLGGGLHEAEVDYLASVEWARSADDILWRRSKLGLHVPPGTAERVERRLSGADAPEASVGERAGVR